MVNIVVIDSNEIYRRGLVSILKECPDFQVVGEANDCREAITNTGGIQPHVAIADLYVSDGEGSETINVLQQDFPGVKVIVMTLSDAKSDFFGAIKSGARGYLSKKATILEIVECIRLVTSGDLIVSPSKVIREMGGFGEDNYSTLLQNNELSPREKEVLRRISHGESNKEIAANCFISETTVKAHLRKILEKMGVRNRAEAVALAASKGLFDTS